MTNVRDVSLEKYEINKYRYRELKYFCYQYDEWIDKINEIERNSIHGMQYSGMPHGSNNVSSEVEKKAIMLLELNEKIDLIKKVSKKVAGDMWLYLLWYVTNDGISLKYLEYKGMPCSRTTFFRYRQQFFYFLDLEKDNLG